MENLYKKINYSTLWLYWNNKSWLFCAKSANDFFANIRPRGLYFGPKTIFIPPPLRKMIFSPLSQHVFRFPSWPFCLNSSRFCNYFTLLLPLFSFSFPFLPFSFSFFFLLSFCFLSAFFLLSFCFLSAFFLLSFSFLSLYFLFTFSFLLHLHPFFLAFSYFFPKWHCLIFFFPQRWGGGGIFQYIDPDKASVKKTLDLARSCARLLNRMLPFTYLVKCCYHCLTAILIICWQHTAIIVWV